MASLFTHLSSWRDGRGAGLSASQLGAFEAYRADLYALNDIKNFTRVPQADCETRHFLDSLLVEPLIPWGASVIDLGSGPGLPAFPLACARPDLRVTALDGSDKLLSFVPRHTLPNLVTLLQRAEKVTLREGFTFVTGRAIAPLPIQLELAAAWATVGGLIVPFRTPNDREEAESFPVAKLGLELIEIREIPLPGTEAMRLFPVYRKVSITPPRYPRAWARIKASPLRVACSFEPLQETSEDS